MIFVLKPFLISLLENEKVVINFINPYSVGAFLDNQFCEYLFFPS